MRGTIIMAGTTTKGICYFCGKSISKSTAKKHLATHEYAEADKQECMLLKIEAPYEKDYWLYADISMTSTLKTLDTFLRDIWLECCGHMSAFYWSDYEEMSFSTKILSIPAGKALSYEYDFGSSTDLKITFVGAYYRKKQRTAVQLLARNDAPEYKCVSCGKPAQQICIDCMYEGEYGFYCNECIDAHQEESEHECMLPVVNSPRMGVCGYEGDNGKFDFKAKRIIY